MRTERSCENIKLVSNEMFGHQLDVLATWRSGDWTVSFSDVIRCSITEGKRLVRHPNQNEKI
jgi:hypothetical protein